MNREALKLAMEGLEWIHRVSAMDYEYQQKALDSLNAIYKALAEQAPMNYYRADAEGNLERTDIHSSQPEQEPVAVWELFEDGWDSIADQEWMETLPVGTKLYTTPPQRTWVGLTDEEVKNFVQAVWPREATATDYIRAIEAKLKELNT